ncbi:MAG TPA: DUF3105 domain-containing protein [Jatrophihabitans sp.]|nr:DUF3105 domain-containing protein [Jatrophihabitans sp.]
MREQERRAERRKSVLVIGGSVLVAALVLGGVGISIASRGGGGGVDPGAIDKTAAISPPAPTGTATTSGATVDTGRTSPIKGVTFYSGLSSDHVTTPVHYAQNPPVGGVSHPIWLNCGIYNDAVPSENAVHDLENGAVWITYQPGLDAAGVAALRNLVASYGPAGSYVTLSPYPGLSSKVVATAWGVQLKLDSATDARLKQFVDTYRKGAQAPVKDGKCSGGTGQPRGTVTNSEATAALLSSAASATATASATGSSTPSGAASTPAGSASATSTAP